ncbi:MAG TPA: Mrp/NBP35 family ATP-binding protein [Chthoniobacteraceae bacterium]|jgi:ATP-binding protein involved in chromosome partitioning|nr:Mrp/NBP35 family ATP-binding protein [Chthoniobacteraceae bacterium]
MPEPTESAVTEALKSVRYPGFSRDIVSFGLVKGMRISEGTVTVQLSLTTNDPKVPQQIKEEAEAAVLALPHVEKATILIDIKAPVQTPGSAGGQPQATQIEGVRHVIAVASGKGGVGKSTVAANLAVALRARGAAVGLCDCDMYGPSMGLMFGSNERPTANEEQQIQPIERHGIKLMSMGFLLDDGAPAILRGPMVTKYTQQFLRQVEWGALDYLILDLPPGTGDIQLTIVQTVALAGAVIVTTPQEVALIDARKASAMFSKVNVTVLGLIENMSFFLCPSDGKRYDIFGHGGGARESQRLGVPLLGQVPIDIPTREWGDRGTPVTVADPASPAAQEFAHIAGKLAELCKI